MILNGKKIRKRLKKAWPDLEQIWLTDPNYIEVSDRWLSRIIDNCSVKNLPFKNDVWDCDNYSLQFHARVQHYQYEQILLEFLDAKHSWAVGECIGIGDGFLGRSVHAMNIIITEGDLVLFEPQENRTIKPDKSYTPFFVKF